MRIDEILLDLIYEGFTDRKRIVYRYYSDAPGFAVAYNRAKFTINYLCKRNLIKSAFPYNKYMLTVEGFARIKARSNKPKIYYQDILEKIPENKLQHSLIANDSRWWLSRFHPDYEWITEHFRSVRGFANEAFIPDFVGIQSDGEVRCLGEVIRTHSSSKALNGKLRVYNDFYPRVPRLWICVTPTQVRFCSELLSTYTGVTNTKVILYNGLHEKSLFDPNDPDLEPWKSLPSLLR